MADLTHWYLHVDLDAFFASVEQLDHPEYRGKPVIVGGKPEDRRSVVSTASYEARKYGVHSAMPTFQAYKLCPNGIYVHGRMQRYSELSYQIMNIFRDYSPDVDQMSIDEAFIDITGTEKLFGPPPELAKTIKERVKKETGLTVSVGLATTKYLAKIASGYQKPNGFTYIHKGDEQNFMLSLPLDKVWGLGPKSLELLRSKGISTTQDIYQKPYETLEFLFGKNMATFLFEVIRGNEKESFSRETKNHSISAETTFPYDLTDIYTIETELLELAHGVFFRLLKHEQYSRTAFVKIRYDDFSTTTIQETVERNILTLDSYFEILKRIFEKKYINGRGIRLLGVGFENVISEDKPYQQDLFSNDDEKKQAVEKAILALEKKHPEIKIRKARTLKAIILFVLMTFFTNKTVYSQTQEQGAGSLLPDTLYVPSSSSENQTETPQTLFDYDIDDEKHVNVSLEGYWAGEFTGSLNGTFGNGEFTFSTGTPLFKQEVELSASVLINNHWFFLGEFAEEFTNNTISIGYKNGEYVKLAKLSNRNVTMTPGYSSEFFGYSLTGGNNQAPGFSIQLQPPSKRWSADFLLRYDMTSTKSKTYYGMNQVSDSTLAPENFMYGRMFRFPVNSKNELYEIENIYVESKQGNYRDKNGKIYKKLSTNDYFVNYEKVQLYISVNADSGISDNKIPSILITFTNNSNVNKIISDSGSYDNENTFLGEIQKTFDLSINKKYELEKFTNPFYTEIDNKNALIIQQSSGFSPYLIANNYDCGLKNNSDLFVIDQSTEIKQLEYEVYSADELFTSINEDYFHDKHTYAQIINQDIPQSYYPFAQTAPEIYLHLPSGSNLKILRRIYSSVKTLNIGTKVSGGSVQVYKNSILDTGAVYNSQTGDITLSSPIVQTDKIVITWQEDSENYSNGAISAGAGLTYNFTQNLKSDASVTVHWPLSFTKNYSTPDDLQPGFAAVSGGIEYNKNGLILTEKTAVALQKENATKELLVCTQKDNVPETYYLPSDAGYYTHAEPSLSAFSIKLFQENNCTNSNLNGISDSKIDGYCIPLSWDFTNTVSPWAAADIKLSAGNLLQRSSELELGLKTDFANPDDINEYDFYLQLGITASKSFYGEDSYLPCYKLNLENKNNEWQTVTVSLSDYDRSRLISNYDARLIVIPKNSNTNLTGTIYIGPYQPNIESIFYNSDSEIIVNTTSYSYNSENYSSVIRWNIPSITDPDDINKPEITAASNFTSSDFSNYESIDFDFYLNADDAITYNGSTDLPGFTFILDTESKDLCENGKIAVELKINSLKNYFSNLISYHTLSINLNSNKVYIDDIELSPSEYNLYINSNIVPSRQKIIINTVTDNLLYKNGNFHIGALRFSNSKLFVSGKNYASVKYQKDKFSINAESQQFINDFSNPHIDVQSNANTLYTVKNVKLGADVSLSNIELANAGHSLKTELPLFNVINLEENYRFNHQDNSLNKLDLISLNFDKINFPLTLKFETKADSDIFLSNQNTKGSISYKYTKNDYSIGFDTYLKLYQSINHNKEENDFNYQNYFNGWYDISKLEFSKGYANASKRDTDFSSKLSGSIPFAGLKPSLEYQLTSNYRNSNKADFTDKETLKLSLPFTFNSNSLSFNISRTAFGTTTDYIYGDYKSDLQKLMNTQSERKWFYTSIPFYELFDQQKINDISANYSAKYETVYKRKLFNSYKDLYIPSQASFSVIRDIKSTDSINDIYQYKTTVTNTSVNNFGAKSKDKLFDWFNQEEIITSLTGIVKIPTDLPENTTYQISAYLQLLLFITDKSTLSSAFDISLETNKNWNSHITLIYTRPSENSLTSSLINLIYKESKKTNFDIIQKELLNIELQKKDNQNKQIYSYNHSSEMKFLKKYSVTTGIGGTFTYIQDSTSNLSLNLTIGAKAEF